MSGKYLIVGLGNPGDRYDETRHNAGFWFLDALCDAGALRLKSKLSAFVGGAALAGHDCVIARPATFMNESGRAVRAVMDYYRIGTDRLLVAYDELDLPPGTVRLKQGGGHGGHNGMRDIFRHLPDQEFTRLRIGIGHPGHKDAVTGYVLSRASSADEALIRCAIGRARDVLPDVLKGKLPNAMKTLHTAEPNDS